jgi:hypothetical protein
LVAADGKLSLVAGIPIVFSDAAISIRTETAAKKSSSTSGNPFNMICLYQFFLYQFVLPLFLVANNAEDYLFFILIFCLT